MHIFANKIRHERKSGSTRNKNTCLRTQKTVVRKCKYFAQKYQYVHLNENIPYKKVKLKKLKNLWMPSGEKAYVSSYKCILPMSDIKSMNDIQRDGHVFGNSI